MIKQVGGTAIPRGLRVEEYVCERGLCGGCDASCLPMYTKSNVISRENDRDCWIKWVRLLYKSIAFSWWRSGRIWKSSREEVEKCGGMWCLFMVCRGKREWGLAKGW